MAVSKKTTDTVVPPVPPVDQVVPPAPTSDVNAGVDTTALPQEGDVTVQTTIPPDAPLTQEEIDAQAKFEAENPLTPEEASQESNEALSIEEIAANQAAADAAFKAANDSVEERVAKEEAIHSMTPEELQAEFGWTVGEAISVLRDAISRSGSIHTDKMNDHLDKIEATSQL